MNERERQPQLFLSVSQQHARQTDEHADSGHSGKAGGMSTTGLVGQPHSAMAHADGIACSAKAHGARHVLLQCYLLAQGCDQRLNAVKGDTAVAPLK